MTIVPPIKSQGIKTKMTSWIQECVASVPFRRWVEPFAGTGVVAFNLRPKYALLCDSNQHLIRFYQEIQSGKITRDTAKIFLAREGEKLLQSGGEHYYAVRERFNSTANSLDFLFLSRSCFNGMMRFNKRGKFNVPFCKKPERFTQTLVTKICNQIHAVSRIIQGGNYVFRHQDFRDTLAETQAGDMVYCDPPYLGRHVDYFDSWSEMDDARLHQMLAGSQAYFILSNWLKNRYRTNECLLRNWNGFSASIKEHFYHVGAQEANRHAIIEILVSNFATPSSFLLDSVDVHGMALKNHSARYPGPTDVLERCGQQALCF